MTATDRERILDRLAHTLPNSTSGNERIVSLSRADVELLRELLELLRELLERDAGLVLRRALHEQEKAVTDAP